MFVVASSLPSCRLQPSQQVLPCMMQNHGMQGEMSEGAKDCKAQLKMISLTEGYVWLRLDLVWNSPGVPECSCARDAHVCADI